MTDNTPISMVMPRDPEDARQRLRRAALELFAERGFDQITAAEIAARAGVTERTFFRHFPDKREVLFDGEKIFGTALSEAIARVPAGLAPIETLHHALTEISGVLERNRPFSEVRHRLIAATPALQEREVAKHAALVQAAAGALERRGAAPQRAHLAAHAGLAILSYALEQWFADPSVRLADRIDRGFAELKVLSAGGG